VVTATRHAETLMPGPFKERVYRSQGWLSPVLLVGGRLLGTWSFQRRGRRLAVRVEPFGPLPGRVRDAAEAHAATLAALLDATAETSFAPPGASAAAGRQRGGAVGRTAPM
jgi:Winged helix DNA-binding domain